MPPARSHGRAIGTHLWPANDPRRPPSCLLPPVGTNAITRRGFEPRMAPLRCPCPCRVFFHQPIQSPQPRTACWISFDQQPSSRFSLAGPNTNPEEDPSPRFQPPPKPCPRSVGSPSAVQPAPLLWPEPLRQRDFYLLTVPGPGVLFLQRSGFDRRPNGPAPRFSISTPAKTLPFESPTPQIAKTFAQSRIRHRNHRLDRKTLAPKAALRSPQLPQHVVSSMRRKNPPRALGLLRQRLSFSSIPSPRYPLPNTPVRSANPRPPATTGARCPSPVRPRPRPPPSFLVPLDSRLVPSVAACPLFPPQHDTTYEPPARPNRI